MNRLQRVIIIVLGTAILIVMVVVVYLLIRPTQREPVSTIPVATVPPNSLLLTREPLCSEVVGAILADQGWPSAITLDALRAVLRIQMDADLAADEEEMPAGQIWGAFEAALASRSEGCAGYDKLVVLVGDYRAEVTVDDLLAWETGAISDAVFSQRVTVTR